MSVRFRKFLGPAAVLAAAAVFGLWLYDACRPTPPGDAFYIRFKQPTPTGTVLDDLQARGVVRNALGAAIYARLSNRSREVESGTYRLAPGMSLSMVFRELRRPIIRLVRLPEGYWLNRTGALLQREDVCSETDYVGATLDAGHYKSLVDFPLPKGGLEGYLYPDTYNLPPLIEPEEIVLKQLRDFEKKVWIPAGRPGDLDRILTVASLVELEAKKDEDRPMIAGVIENRLKLGMPLQIDATVLYARGRWGLLSKDELSGTESEYNTYLHTGLPPGPICSPTLKSVQAAMNPAKHDYLYYVAMPDGGHVFSRTLAEQNHNIRLSKQLRRARA